MNKTKTTWQGIVAMVIAIIGVAFFGYQIPQVYGEIDTKTVGSTAQSAATAMTQIESRAGNSIDEAFYQDMGKYLVAQSKIENAHIWQERYIALGIDTFGIVFCLALFLWGASQSRPVQKAPAKK